MEVTTGGVAVLYVVSVWVAVVLLDVVTTAIGVGIFKHEHALEISAVA